MKHFHCRTLEDFTRWANLMTFLGIPFSREIHADGSSTFYWFPTR